MVTAAVGRPGEIAQRCLAFYPLHGPAGNPRRLDAGHRLQWRHAAGTDSGLVIVLAAGFGCQTERAGIGITLATGPARFRPVAVLPLAIRPLPRSGTGHTVLLQVFDLLSPAELQVADGGDHLQVLTQDVVEALQAIGHDETLPEHRRNRAIEMGDGMALFCYGLAGHFFNRPGRSWPATDVTILEMGILAREGYEDQLTVAYISMMSHINDLVERHQHDARPTLVVTDEGHIITTNPLLARYVVKITKMWRKLGAWFWIATQNLEDFPDASRKMLNMMEWWLCLVMPKEEIEQIARFKDLSAEQRSLLLSARKEPGKYVEGVVLSDNLEALFRNVPPPLSLALAMTEKHEKAERAAIMQAKGCSELEAVQIVAQRISVQRGV